MPAASTCSSRTTRTRSRSPPAPTAARRSPAGGCTTACSPSAARKMSKSLGNVLQVHELLQAASARGAAPAAAARPLPAAAGLVRRRHRAGDQHAGRLVPRAARPRSASRSTHGALPVPDRDRGGAVRRPQHAAGAGRTVACWPMRHASPARAEAKAALLGGGALLGLLQQDPEAWFQRGGDDRSTRAQVEALLEERRDARAARDFARADAIRDELGRDGRGDRGRCARHPLERQQGAERSARDGTLRKAFAASIRAIMHRHERDNAPPPAPTEAQQQIAEEFAFFSDWTERYQYLIDLGKQLPPFPDDAKTEEQPRARLPVDGLAGAQRRRRRRCTSRRSATRRSSPA